MTTPVLDCAPGPRRPEPPITPVPGMGYQPGLDGLRAISVVAVLLYHGGIAWLPGGFLGVEVFFVVSGYLITALLLEEWDRTGRVDLGRFWLRRARRLLPALFLMIGVTAVAALVAAPDAVAQLRGDVLAAATYVTNWWLIVSDQSYFEALGRPPLLRHLWSLAVEEQFYLLWPLVFVGGMTLVRGRRRSLVIPVLALVAASLVAMLALYTPDADPSRVYYGTDTRAAGILLGAALAFVWAPWKRRPASAPAPRLDLVGAVAVAVLVGFFARTDEYGSFLYQGGLFLVSIASAVAIAAVVHPGARLFRAVMGWAPLVWVGLRSYGLYLWHWPIFMLLRPQDTGLDGGALLAVRLAVTVVVAEASFRFVEQPIRRGAIGRFVARYRAAPGVERARLTSGLRVAGATAWILLVAVGVRVATAPEYDPITGEAKDRIEVAAAAGVPTESADASSPVTTAAPDASPFDTAGADAAGVGPVSVPPTTARLPRRVVVVGDSQARALVANAPEDELAGTLVLTNGAVEGCGIVDQGRMKTVARWRRTFDECDGFEAKWRRSAEAAQAEVALVVLGAWEVFDLVLDDDVELRFGTPESDAYLRSQLRLGIDALKAAGAQVALLEVPCFRPVDGGGLKALPERGDDTRTRHLNALLREAAAADPANVRVVDSPDAYCAEPAIATDLGHRWDGVHYYKPGADLVFDTVTPQLLDIPVG